MTTAAVVRTLAKICVLIEKALIATVTGSNTNPKYPRLFVPPGKAMQVVYSPNLSATSTFMAYFDTVLALNSTVTCPSSSLTGSVVMLSGGRIDFSAASVPLGTSSRTWMFWWMSPQITSSE